MGKKNKKTRWRTLTLNGHQSDSEESSTKSSLQTSKSYQHKYSKFPYSSQSTPIRKFQHESSKSTRSNSTTSEHKATFNEDEYTRITTPRQDVLFKKGYLNKPKNYQTQMSTGTSSTANSTSTCTPDHQSADGTEGTDLEYESQFVFPNGFIDHNGIYYINSYEPFPFVVYNAPICYPEYPNSRSKRYSTDSMTESVSPQNEEINQELPQNGIGERIINNIPVFTQNYVQPSGYYYSNNGAPTLTNGQCTIEETRRIKKKRRRKISRTKSSNNEDLTSEESDNYDSCDEVFSQSEYKRLSKSNHMPSINQQIDNNSLQSENTTQSNLQNPGEPISLQNGHDDNLRISQENHTITENSAALGNDATITEQGPLVHVESEQNQITSSKEEEEEQQQQQQDQTKSNSNDAQNLLLQSLLKSSEKNSESDHSNTDKPNSISESTKDCINDELQESSLKPDAEEFIPRTLKQPEPLSFDPNIQFLNLPPNFIPVPFVNHIGEMQRPPPFLPPGIPLNFILPQDTKVLPNFVNVVPNGNFVPKTNYDGCTTEISDTKPCQEEEKQIQIESSENPIIQNELQVLQVKKSTKTEIDIAKIVSKLEEAAKQQRYNDTKRHYGNRNGHRYNTPKLYQNQKGRFLNNNFHQRNRSSNFELSYERKFRKTEAKSKPKANTEDQEKLERTVPKIKEDQLQTNVSSEEPVALLEEKTKHETKQDLVNNVNIRLNDNCSIINKDLQLESNYSETLKKKADTVQQNNVKINKPNKCPRFEKHNIEKNENKVAEKAVIVYTTPKPQRTQNQWISVSNRKKRKNKNNEEQNSLDEQEELLNDEHLFESFDVNLLVDVMPPSKTDDSNQDVLNEIETVSQEKHDSVDTEVQKDALSATIEIKEEKVTETTTQIKEKPPVKSKNRNEDKKRKSKKKAHIKRVIITDVASEPENPIPLNLTEDKKQQDVSAQPNLEKADILPVDNIENVKQPVLDEVLANEDTSTAETTANKLVEEPISVNEVVSETPEKKSKKKKKKTSPKQPALGTAKTQSASSSSMTLNNLDVSYDFLLENSVLEELEQKTNIEISQELDRIIQKGLYSNLEEKIRALKITAPDDGFFKSMNSSYHVPEKPNNFINASNIGKVLKNTTPLLKMPKGQDEMNQENLINIDFSKIKLPDLEPQPSTSKAGVFLENPEITKIIGSVDHNHVDSLQEISKLDETEKMKNEVKQGQDTTEKEEQLISEKGEKQNATIEQDTKNLTTTSNTFSFQPKQDTLYPITQAIKEWMNKTRENTPDVEILKSPNTIYKEFCTIETETESESTEDSKNGHKGLSIDKSTNRESSPPSNHSKENNLSHAKVKRVFKTDDEITVWSLSPQNSTEQDLIDCWENEELEPNDLRNDPIIQNGGIKEIKGSVQNGHVHHNGHIEEGEEAIEVYESKYGKNEDYLRLKAEIEEQRRNMNFPRHGDLPYRAICCSIM